MYNVYQHWDPLKVCIVGRSYPSEFYSFITNVRVRLVMERIAQETEEDYQKLIALLESFGVKVLRPEVSSDPEFYKFNYGGRGIKPPPMTPRDYTMMLGSDFFFKAHSIMCYIKQNWHDWRGDSWPDCPTSIEGLKLLPDFVKQELLGMGPVDVDNHQEFVFNTTLLDTADSFTWRSVLEHIQQNTRGTFNQVPWYLDNINSAESTRIGKDIYLGTKVYGEDLTKQLKALNNTYSDYRWNSVDTGGHTDGTYCPVKPGLIVSLEDIPTYEKTFPGWEVVYLPGQSWKMVEPFLKLKEKKPRQVVGARRRIK